MWRREILGGEAFVQVGGVDYRGPDPPTGLHAKRQIKEVVIHPLFCVRGKG